MRRTLISLIALALIASACSNDGDSVLTIYSGRSEELVGPLIERFEETSGIAVEVRYADSVELAATIREEGANSPADVLFAQDPASLGVVALEGLFSRIPRSLLDSVPSRFSARDGSWIGVSGRARAVVYDTRDVDPTDLPETVSGFLDPAWTGRVALAPTNGSFLAFVASMILLEGEEATRTWLEGMAAAGAHTYSSNSVIVTAVDGGEVDTGLVNHYYLFRRIAEFGDVDAANHFLSGGAGALVMPAGAGVLASSDQSDDAVAFIEFLLTEESQRYFVTETFEYPLIAGVEAAPSLPPLDSINQPDIDLSDLAGVMDLATDLVAEAGLL